jgi:fructokinase
VLKLNHEELATLAPMLQLSGDERECVAQLGRRYGLVAVALTRGPRGSLLWTPSETVEHYGVAVEVRDTVGSGDAFTAALSLGLLAQWPLPKISDHANAVAAFVCSQDGAMPTLPDSLQTRFLARAEPHIS